ncbi:MAG TPA: asparagine synthase (glutamine-hydrolyzing) [Candidatus Dormibacteraeota bacterium]|nr:asparagine synthase (glutamine-hydrolyzing) [Candidatus Dormibacteraeota bacterium]
MCGIAGIYRFDGAPVEEATLLAMASRLVHRGPDGDGRWRGPAVGLASRRLSIIDLAGSRQPMESHDGRRHVAFNGEILNYRELRAGMRYPFRTRGDTEVLLAAFEADGADGVRALEGQFAYAIHDEADDSLWLFRDRLGILPLHYYVDARMLAFASEIKALLPALPHAPAVDEDSLDSYLAQRAVPAPDTLFRGIRKLPPGHHLHATRDGAVEVRRYWSLPDAASVRDVPDADAVDMVAAALERSVESALVADVPVGAYLSGGVDSSLIAALVGRVRGPGELCTFSAGFGDPRHDELPVARRVSALLGTRHHEVDVRPSDLEGLWERLTWHRDAPLSEPADVAVHLLAELARDSVKVVLSGEGSDEIFGGYPKYRLGRLSAATVRLPAAARGPLAASAARLLPAAATRPRIALRAMGAASGEEQMRAWFAPFTAAERLRLLGRRGRPWQPEVLASASGDAVRRMLHVDTHSWLADNLLERGDRMTMSASVELRPPFLDHRVVELAFRLPSRVKVRGGVTKWVVKQVALRHLPRDVVERRKTGFRVPVDAWLRGDLRPMARDLLLSSGSFATSVMDRAAIARLLADHESGRANEDIRIWTLLSLEVWHRTFFRACAPEAATA